MHSKDKPKKYSKEELLHIVDTELKNEPYYDRLKEELLDHLEDQENFGQISGKAKRADALGDPRVVTLLCKSFLSQKKARVAFGLLALVVLVGIVDFFWYIFYPEFYSSLRAFLFVCIETILIISIAYLLPSFRAKDLW